MPHDKFADRTWFLPLGSWRSVLKVIKHGDSTSQNREPVSTVLGYMVQYCD